MNGVNLRDILSSGQPVTCPGARYGARSKLGDIPASGLPASIVTAPGDVNLSAAFCAGHIAAGATLATLGAVVDLTAYTIGDIGWYGNLTVQNLVAGLLADGSAGNYTIADLIAIMVNRQVLDWENLDPAVLSSFGTNRDGRVRWEATAEMVSDGGGSADLTATITLPPGFRYDTGPLFSEAELRRDRGVRRRRVRHRPRLARQRRGRAGDNDRAELGRADPDADLHASRSGVQRRLPDRLRHVRGLRPRPQAGRDDRRGRRDRVGAGHVGRHRSATRSRTATAATTAPRPPSCSTTRTPRSRSRTSRTRATSTTSRCTCPATRA